MATVEPLNEERQGATQTAYPVTNWQEFDEDTIECRVLICPECDGGYSVHALRLPGVVSQGETIEEALTNIVDAFRATIAVYREETQVIPWQDIEIERTNNSVERWILVNV